MFDRVLRMLANRLSDALSRASGLEGRSVVLAPLVDADGEASTARLVMTLAGLTSDPHHRGRRPAPPQAGPPPLYLTAFVLISAGVRADYAEGLKLLASAARLLHRAPRLDRFNAPDLPDGIDELVIEPHDLSFEASSDLWSMLGAPYRPALLYRLRGLPLLDDVHHEAGPPVREVIVEGGP